MRNLHTISPELSDFHKSALWWFNVRNGKASRLAATLTGTKIFVTNMGDLEKFWGPMGPRGSWKTVLKYWDAAKRPSWIK